MLCSAPLPLNQCLQKLAGLLTVVLASTMNIFYLSGKQIVYLQPDRRTTETASWIRPVFQESSETHHLALWAAVSQCSFYLNIWWIAFQQTMMRRGEEEWVGIGELRDPYLRAKVVMLSWLSWLAPSLVVKVSPSGNGEERRGELQPAPRTVSFVWATSCNGKLHHRVFFWGLSAQIHIGSFPFGSSWEVQQNILQK